MLRIQIINFSEGIDWPLSLAKFCLFLEYVSMYINVKIHPRIQSVLQNKRFLKVTYIERLQPLRIVCLGVDLIVTFVVVVVLVLLITTRTGFIVCWSRFRVNRTLGTNTYGSYQLLIKFQCDNVYINNSITKARCDYLGP